jgi:2'-5' RNA ligase
MKTWNQFLIEKENVDYDFSSVQVNLPEDIAEKIIKWTKENIPDNELYTKDLKYGREDEIHTTILYGLHTNNEKDIKKLVNKQNPISFTLGKISVFNTNPDYDVVKIDVTGNDLHKLNKLLKSNLKYTSSYPDYHPHVTLAYVKKGNGKKYIGLKKFDNQTIISKELIFSPQTGNKTKIKL